MKYQPEQSDEATVVDLEPHWSSVRNSLMRVRAQAAQPAPVRGVRVAQVVQVAPIVPIAPAAPITPPRLAKGTVPPPLPPAIPRSAASVVPVAPRPIAPPRPVYMLPTTVTAEPQYGLETERVAPLPLSSLRPSWETTLVNVWQRFAAPICGAIAGLIFIVGYLAYSSQGGRAVAASAAPVAMPTDVAIVMPVEAPAAEPAAMEEPVVSPAALAEPTVSEVRVVRPAKATKRVSSSSKRVASSKRRPIHLNDSTPLGDLRPSRSR